MAKIIEPSYHLPTAGRISSALTRKNYTEANNEVLKLIELNPSEENHAIYRRTISSVVDGYMATGKVKAVTDAIRGVEKFAANSPEWAEEVAVLYAKIGEFAKAKQFAALSTLPTTAAKVGGYIADLLVRRNRPEPVPEDYRVGLHAILNAFKQYEAGQDEAAKATLQVIGLQSPFLEWKLTLRGLMAYTANDDARAIENWQRLSPTRMPSKFIVSLHASIDPSQRTGHTADDQKRLTKASDQLSNNPLIKLLKELQSYLGRETSMTSVWRVVRQILPMLKTTYPDLATRLAACMYVAVLNHGQPKDAQTLVSIFGTYADDPHMHRLEAIACDMRQLDDQANEYWLMYESWLAGSPKTWPVDVAKRARSMILLKMAHRSQEIAEGNDDGDGFGDEFEAMYEAFGGPDRQKKPKKSGLSEKTIEDLFARSAALAPDWAPPTISWVDQLLEVENYDKAKEVAEKFLERYPDTLPLLEVLHEMHTEQLQPAEALAVSKRMLAINPLDTHLQIQLGSDTINYARAEMVAENYASAESVLANGQAGLSSHKLLKLYQFSIESTIARKTKRVALADELLKNILGFTPHQLLTAYILSVDAALAKLKPADKKIADARLAEALDAKTLTAIDLSLTYTIWSRLGERKYEYRGQKTHGTKLLALIQKLPLTAGEEGDFEHLMNTLYETKSIKVAKILIGKLRRFFRSNPCFALAEAKLILLEKMNHQSRDKARKLLNLAKELIRTSTNPAHQLLLDDVEEALLAIPEQYNPFDFIFGRR